jgi:DNA-binding NarL/FixJ family response regulator
MPVPVLIEIGHDAATRQARSGWASLTPTEAKVAKRVEEGLSNQEIAATLLLSRRTVATASRVSCGSSVHSRIDIAREPALRAAASR